MARVYITRAIAPEAVDMLRARHEVEMWPEPRAIPRDVLLEKVAGQDGLLCIISERIDDELLDRAPSLKIVANMAVGFDNIDVPACTRRGVVATNTPGVLTETTADFAFALMMAVARQLVPAERYVREGRWKTWDPALFVGQDIHHSRLGIVGMGRIGAEVARRARGFDMRVQYYDAYRREDLEAQLGVEYVPFETLLAESDFITIHVDLNPATRKLFGREQLARMKPTAYLVNAARGPIVDTEALFAACRDGRIGGAALDVTDPEPLPPDHPILQLPNVIVCPHIASASVRTRTAMATLAAENILLALDGQPPKTPLN